LNILITKKKGFFASLGEEYYGEKKGWSGKNERLCEERILEDLISS
jgi:hypothetical protein